MVFSIGCLACSKGKSPNEKLLERFLVVQWVYFPEQQEARAIDRSICLGFARKR